MTTMTHSKKAVVISDLRAGSRKLVSTPEKAIKANLRAHKARIQQVSMTHTNILRYIYYTRFSSLEQCISVPL